VCAPSLAGRSCAVSLVRDCAMDTDCRAEIEERIGYRFRRAHLLETAFTHAGYAKDAGHGHLSSNERLEFLGDSVLGLVVAEWLYRERTRSTEGELTPLKARYVSATALAIACAEMGLGTYLELSPGEESTGGRLRQSNLADLFEAVVGAVYLDSGYRAARDFVRRHLIECRKVNANETLVEPKSALQEVCLAAVRQLPTYQVVGRSGPDHKPVFTVRVLVAGREMGVASGASKKLAEREAARIALGRLDDIGPADRGD